MSYPCARENTEYCANCWWKYGDVCAINNAYHQGKADAIDEFLKALTDIDEGINMDIYTNLVRKIAEQIKEEEPNGRK